MKVKIILEDGQIFEGTRIGATKDVVCEMVFNTAVTGYVELMTDPSYAGQGVVMSSPIIGNYGIFKKDFESHRPWLSALIVRYKTTIQNDPRQAEDLDHFLRRYDIPGVVDVDTRLLTLTIREKGTLRGMITGKDPVDVEECLRMIRAYSYHEPVRTVSIPQKRIDRVKERLVNDRNVDFRGKKVDNDMEEREVGIRNFRTVLWDFGAKANIRRLLLANNCDVISCPWDTTASEILQEKPDGIVLSNGPGDPKDCQEVINQLKILTSFPIPIFGICLGHQLIALSFGFDTHKLKYGHRGVNHPVKNLTDGRCYITSQNHSYCVTTETVDPAVAAVSFININDLSVEGLQYQNRDIFTVQFHPEGAPGPMDTVFLFREFTKHMGVKG